MKTAMGWARRDPRLSDNQALAAAPAQADQVVPAFVLDPTLLAENAAAIERLAFLFEGLRAALEVHHTQAGGP